MDISPIAVIWCDVSFEREDSYQSMKNEFNAATTAAQPKSDSIDTMILNEEQEELLLNNVPVITVRTPDDAVREIEDQKTKGKKIFVICSGTLGRYLVPELLSKCPYIHNFYIYAHSIALHIDWSESYPRGLLKMFNFHITLLLRLTRDISSHFIEHGKMFLLVDDPQNALALFNHARNLEIGANKREKMPPNPKSKEPNYAQPDFRGNLDLLEGHNGLIAQAVAAVRAKGIPVEDSSN